MNTQEHNSFDCFELTNQQKIGKLFDLAVILEAHKIDNNGEIKDSMKDFSKGYLEVINECNESWCDSCPVRRQLPDNMLCSEWLGF